MFEIRKRFAFSASHQLAGLPPDHACGRLHGHNYEVEILLLSPTLNEYGFVVDYGDLRPFKELLDRVLDHQHLNNVLNFQPTAENLAKWLYDHAKEMWPQTIAVRVSETPATWAEYRTCFDPWLGQSPLQRLQNQNTQ